MNTPNARSRSMLAVKEVALELSVSEKSVRRWIADGTIPHSRHGRVIRVSADDLAAYVRRTRR